MRRVRVSARRSLLGSLLDRGPMLTPLIDIMFLVLIFFMVNNSPAQRSLGVRPPYMTNAAENKQNPSARENDGELLLLAVRPDLSYSIQLQSFQDRRILAEAHSSAAFLDTGHLLKALQLSLQNFWSQDVRRIRLRADQSLSYATVIGICDLLYRWQLPLDLDVSDSSIRGTSKASQEVSPETSQDTRASGSGSQP